VTALLLAIGTLLAGGALALALSARPRAASTVAAASVVAAALLGLTPTLRVLSGGPTLALRLAWAVPFGELSFEMDRLSAFFLLPVLVLPALAAVFGSESLCASRGSRSLGPPWFFYNVFVAAMASVTLARNGVLFLVVWEIMALSGYALVTFEQEKAEVRRAGWIYLIATHLGTAALVAMFLVLADGGGRYDFAALRAIPPSATRSLAVLSLAAIGFGAKAGFVPMHVWLPEAHAAAPSHVSAVMSGVLIKLGIYGLLRAVMLAGEPSVWLGRALIVIGFGSALLGIALAIYQEDMKRALAYSSIENVGLITLGLGLGFWGRATERPEVATLGMTAALLHIWSHSAMKGAMFLGAGSVLHGAGTKRLDRLGGLLARMPYTGATLLVGATALAALPPMNGFLSEWLLVLALVRGGTTPVGHGNVGALLGVGALVLVGAMAALSFARLVGVSLLGQPRSDEARDAHESSPWMLAPMGLLVGTCIFIAFAPSQVVHALSPLATDLAGASLAPHSAPLATLGACNAALSLTLAAVAFLLRRATRKERASASETWGCGYVAPSHRMQYTGRSFSQLFEWMLPARLRPRLAPAQPGLARLDRTRAFPATVAFATDASDPLTRGIYEPFFSVWGTRFARLRWLQQGSLHAYVLYILVTLMLGLTWVSFRAWSGT